MFVKKYKLLGESHDNLGVVFQLGFSLFLTGVGNLEVGKDWGVRHGKYCGDQGGKYIGKYW